MRTKRHSAAGALAAGALLSAVTTPAFTVYVNVVALEGAIVAVPTLAALTNPSSAVFSTFSDCTVTSPVWSLCRLITEHRLPYCRRGGECLFDKRELDAWVRGYDSAIAMASARARSNRRREV